MPRASLPMSKAFTKEEDEQPERVTRMRSLSGLPPGAVNYMTADGARWLEAELALLPEMGCDRAAELSRILQSATIVEPPADPPEGAVFGAKVELRDAEGISRSYRITGVDEISCDDSWVSWISPIGKSLLGSVPGQRVAIDVDGQNTTFTVVRIDY